VPAENEALFREREELVNSMLADMLARIPDFHTAQDGAGRILIEVYAGVLESVFLALQILSEDMFAHTANFSALQRHGVMYGTPLKSGEVATGFGLFSGVGGTYVPIGAEVAYDVQTGADPLYFITTDDDNIPNPGIPSAPTLADGGAGALPAGTYEYVVTFETAAGETLPGAESLPIVLAASKFVALTNVPLGGPGTIRRRLYRSVNGGPYLRVTGGADSALNDNVTTSANDGSTGLVTPVPTVGAAEAILLPIQAEEPGTIYNLSANSITVLANVPDGVLAVTNPSPMAGGTDQQDMEDFRESLLQAIRNPGSGSKNDIKQWAEEVFGVETATVFPNDNMGVATNGHTTIRIAGPNGVIPSADVQTEVLLRIQEEGLANIIYHVTTFTQVSTDVTCDITVETDFIMGDVQPNAEQAIRDFINALQVGETLRISELIAAIVVVPGVFDVTVSVPATNQTTSATQKRIPGTITVT
jgi:uncharacterized phage protein gp47/JayE